MSYKDFVELVMEGLPGLKVSSAHLLDRVIFSLDQKQDQDQDQDRSSQHSLLLLMVVFSMIGKFQLWQ